MESWATLADMKESHLVETPEFACARGTNDEAAFVWWVPYTLHKHDGILSAVRSRLRKTMHKNGIKIPNNVNHAMELATEVWHIPHFRVSYGRCATPGSPMGLSEGLP